VSQLEAEKVIESLRNGLPYEGKISELTVGRKDEIDQLKEILSGNQTTALLVNANIGCGKTHLLKFIKEEALKMGYITSLITLDSTSSVRFNRMDQIFGEICRNIQIPGNHSKSIRNFLDSLFNKDNEKANDLIKILSNESKWNDSNLLSSPSLFVAVRAWSVSFANNHKVGLDSLVEDWLSNPYNYYSNRKYLYDNLVGSSLMKRHFREPRPDWVFYREGIFNFQQQGYIQSWNALKDLNFLAKKVGYRGLIVLVDEFEDVIHNLNNIKYQQSAFLNLFKFFSKELFPGLILFAVTPDFVNKCKILLLQKKVYEYDYSSFEELEKIEMSPLTLDKLIELSEKIINFHKLAYFWDGENHAHDKIRNICIQSSNISIQDRVRQTIKKIVKELDEIADK
jgi:Cdc6-like AAA superfamily ATPase